MKSRDVYSANKVLYQLDRINLLRNNEFITPVHLELILTNKCNHDCIYCAYRNERYLAHNFNPQDEIDYTKALEIITDFKLSGGKCIQFTGGGEPLLHPKINEILAHTLNEGLEIALVTNGDYLNKLDQNIINNLTWLRISLDAGTEEIFKKYRKVKTFNNVINNIENLKTSATVGLGFVINDINYIDIQNFTDLVCKFNIDNVRFSAVFTEQKEKIFTYEMIDDIDFSLHYAENKLKANNIICYNNFHDRYSDLMQKPYIDKCNYMRFVTYIGADLNLYSCCVYSYNNNGFIASLKDQTLFDAYNNKDIQNRIMNFNPKTCKFCMFNNKNEAMEDIIYNKPEHINFI